MKKRDLKHLRQLNLGHNELQRVPAEIFENFTTLEWLSFEDNPLTIPDQTIFSTFTKLRKGYFYKKKIQKIFQKFLGMKLLFFFNFWE